MPKRRRGTSLVMLRARPTSMRFLLALCCALLLAACGGSESPADALPPRGLVVKNPSGERPFYHLFGSVPEGEIARHVFELENTNPEPLSVLRLQTACGCTMPSVRLLVAGREPESIHLLNPGTLVVVPPRGVLELELAIDTAHVPQKNTFWLATAHLTTDSAASAYVHFELSLFVDAPLQITPRELDLGNVPQTGGAWAKATAIRAVPSSSVRVTGVSRASPELLAEVEQREHFGKPVWELRVELPPGLPKGPYRGEVRLDVVDEQDAPPTGAGSASAVREVLVPVRGLVVDDIITRPAVLFLGEIQAGEPGRGEARVISLIPGRRIVVREPRIVDLPADSLRVVLEPVGPDALGRAQEWKVTLEVTGELPRPRFSGTLRLSIDEPEGPSSVELRFSGSYR